MCRYCVFYLFFFQKPKWLDSSKVCCQETHLTSYQDKLRHSRTQQNMNPVFILFTSRKLLILFIIEIGFCKLSTLVGHFLSYFYTNCCQPQTRDVLEMLKSCRRPTELISSILWFTAMRFWLLLLHCIPHVCLWCLRLHCTLMQACGFERQRLIVSLCVIHVSYLYSIIS